MLNPPNLDKINQICRDSEEADNAIRAEARSNVLLYAGEHYAKRTDAFGGNSRFRETRAHAREQKLRLTKNHIGRIIDYHINSVITAAPGVIAAPNNDNELSDLKSADLHTSVIKGLKKKHDLKRREREGAQDFFINGEVISKVFWNPRKGDLIGYLPKMEDDGETMMTDEWGRPIPGDEAVFKGDLDFKRIWSWDLIRPKHALSAYDAEFLGFNSMVQKDVLKAEYANQPDKLKFIDDASQEQYKIFDPGNGTYSDSKDQVKLREIYWKKCAEYPEGWYCISTSAGILEEGVLPMGIFPLVIGICREYQSSPRGRSPIKTGRPMQAEINRAASKQAEHQVTIGDDKVIMPNGAKLTEGPVMPGVRGFHSTGDSPVVIQGRSGAQFQEYIQYQVEELYSAMNSTELLEEKANGQIDPYAQLYRSMKQKYAFSIYVERFGRYLIDWYTLILETYRAYCPDDEVIPMIGKSEAVNIEEFKNSEPLNYQISLEETTDDVDSSMGRQLVFNQIIQYVGKNLTRNDLGKIISEMPLLKQGNEIFSDLTMDQKIADNIILGLDRGKMPALKPGFPKEYLISRLSQRQVESDYDFLHPQIQQMYDICIMELNNALIAEQQQLKAMQADFIPAQGYLTTCDFYVSDPKNPESTKRAKIPMDSIAWLIDRLEAQGSSLERLEEMPQAAQGRLATQANQGQTAQESIGGTSQTDIQGGNLNVSTYGERG